MKTYRITLKYTYRAGQRYTNFTVEADSLENAEKLAENELRNDLPGQVTNAARESWYTL